MNKQSLLLHSILISSALFSLMPAASIGSSQQATPSPTQRLQVFQADAMLMSSGQGIPQSRGGGGTR
jgi:hypothetical protein